ncbi:MAG: heme NO-binding domain-containing protein [Pseudomonadota bacterium]|nr:heme NO-binding domain-containing protein [Pseudomonadota bacterium]MDP1905077.1 heme NO-binding domain-containing protein [Pseudomonadota bacterium]MDP2352181.1 heme NO-binding domain-containing protein [Pseudomonadota bacterium]
MKGMIFTEFMEMVEATWSQDMVDTLIARSQVPSGGAYTSVGTYPHEEIIALVAALSQETGVAAPSLIRTFGRHLFSRFALGYPRFLQGMTCTLQFLAGIENVIHAEVRKLYPDAELPTFEVEQAPGSLTLTYFSDHPFADLAHGLIEGCIAHFGENIEVLREAIADLPGAQARFTLTRKD